MASLANIVLDVKSTSPSLKATVIANTISTSVTNNTLINTIKNKLTTSTNPVISSLTQWVNISAASLSVVKKIAPEFIGPATYANTNQVEVLKGWFAGGDGARRLIKSADGVTWTNVPQSALANGVEGLAYGEDQNSTGVVVAVGTGGATVAYSTDFGNSWIRGTPTTIHGSYGRGVMFGRDISNVPVWYSVGQDVVPMACSYNGMNWTSKGATIGGTSSLRGIVSGNNQYLALGGGGIKLSTDYGNSWTSVSTLTEIGYSAAWGIDANGVGRWIAVGMDDSRGGQGVITQSTDGITWTKVPSAATYMSKGYTITYGEDAAGNKRWVLGGTGGKLMVYTSDGVTFTQCSGLGGLGNIYSVKYGKKADGSPLWIAAGSGWPENFIKSVDGITWTSITDRTNLFPSSALSVECVTVKYNKPVYLNYTPGKPELYASIDGKSASKPLKSPFTVAVNKMAWNGSMWVGVGEGTNTVATSTNGIIWTGLGTTLFSTKGTNVEWNTTQNKWYIYGEGTNTVLTSVNGVNWV